MRDQILTLLNIAFLLNLFQGSRLKKVLENFFYVSPFIIIFPLYFTTKKFFPKTLLGFQFGEEYSSQFATHSFFCSWINMVRKWNYEKLFDFYNLQNLFDKIKQKVSENVPLNIFKEIYRQNSLYWLHNIDMANF